MGKKLASNYRRGHVYLRGDTYWVKYHKDGKAFYESTRSRRHKDAVELLNKRLANPTPVKAGPVMIGELLDDYLDYYKQHHPKSYESFAISRVKAMRPFWGGIKANAVTTQDIKEFVKQESEKGMSNATINRAMSVLRKSFNLAKEATPPKVGSSFPKYHRLPEAPPRKGFLETPQYHALLEALPEELRCALVIGYHTGLRRGEVLRIRIEQVDLKDEKIRLYDTKKHVEGRWLPIYGEMRGAIKKQIADTRRNFPGCPWLCHREGRRMPRIGLKWNTARNRVGLEGLLFHDLRRSAVRNMIRAGIPEAVAMKISGHKTRAVFDRYNIVSGRDIEDAGKKLERFLESGGGMEGTITQQGNQYTCPACKNSVPMLFYRYDRGKASESVCLECVKV
jgi:integrase